MSIKYGEWVVKKIPQEIILVEKPSQNKREYNQAYIVIEKDKKSMENALDWASRSYYNFETHDYDRIEPIVNTYKNGEFELTIKNSAEGSNQGGKLSFWNCIIKTPDNKELLVGIAADSLLELLLENTFVNGKCQNKIFLGRIGSRQAAITSNMQLFKEAQEDNARKAKIKASTTSQYHPGDLVVTPTLKEIYLGEISLPFQIKLEEFNNSSPVIDLEVYEKPKVFHLYADYTWWENNKELHFTEFFKRASKLKRSVEKEIPEVSAQLSNDGLENLVESKLEYHLNANYTSRNEFVWVYMIREAMRYKPEDNLIDYIKKSMESCKKEVVKRYNNYYAYCNFIYNIINGVKND